MEIGDVKKNMGKRVWCQIDYNSKPLPYLLSAYIFRVGHKDIRKRFHQLELKEVGVNSVIITNMEDVLTEEEMLKKNKDG